MRPTNVGIRSALTCGILLVLLGACGTSSSSQGSSTTTSKPAAPKSMTVEVGSNPQASVLDPATQTLYANNSPETDNLGTVFVYNSSTCNALKTTGCVASTPYTKAGYGPVAMALDQATDTIYVVNTSSSTSTSNNVSVINGATCNSRNTSGCKNTPPAVPVGSGPVDAAVNQATDTIYVANWGNGSGTTLSVINGRTCNGQVTSGCRQVPATVTLGTAPAGVIVDQSTDTIYAGTVAPSGAEAVWVINGATCNARTTSGCGEKPLSVTVGSGSANYNVAFAIDRATHTLYVANFKDNTLSMIDTATCNATTTSGCARTPRLVRAGGGPTALAVNTETHTLYVANLSSNSVSVLNAATCNASVASGCGKAPEGSMRTGSSPEWVTVDQANDTVYVLNGDDGTMSVLNGATCNATETSGCG
jgi:YVTN family beta-propeller protein